MPSPPLGCQALGITSISPVFQVLRPAGKQVPAILPPCMYTGPAAEGTRCLFGAIHASTASTAITALLGLEELTKAAGPAGDLLARV